MNFAPSHHRQFDEGRVLPEALYPLGVAFIVILIGPEKCRQDQLAEYSANT